MLAEIEAALGFVCHLRRRWLRGGCSVRVSEPTLLFEQNDGQVLAVILVLRRSFPSRCILCCVGVRRGVATSCASCSPRLSGVRCVHSASGGKLSLLVRLLLLR